MPSHNPPKKNSEYILYVSLRSQTNTKIFQTAPTLAAGDVKVSINGGALTNLSTLPVVTPAGSKLVKVTLSAAEMNGDNISVVFSDAAGDQWCDLTVNLQTAVNQFDDLNTAVPPTAAAIRTELDSNSTKLALLDTAVSTRLAAAGYTAPDNASIASILADTDFLQVLFAGLTEDVSGNRFTAKALEQAPAGGGGGGDATLANQNTIIGYVDALETRLTAGRADNLDNLDEAISTLNNITAADVWQRVIEGGDSAEQILRVLYAVLAGVSTGGGTTTLAFRDKANSKDRLNVTVDSNGNRTAVNSVDGS